MLGKKSSLHCAVDYGVRQAEPSLERFIKKKLLLIFLIFFKAAGPQSLILTDKKQWDENYRTSLIIPDWIGSDLSDGSFICKSS